MAEDNGTGAQGVKTSQSSPWAAVLVVLFLLLVLIALFLWGAPPRQKLKPGV